MNSLTGVLYNADTLEDSTQTQMDGAGGKTLHCFADHESCPAIFQAPFYLQTKGDLACPKPVLLTRMSCSIFLYDLHMRNEKLELYPFKTFVSFCISYFFICPQYVCH